MASPGTVMNKTQQKLIEATERLLHRDGLARVTTRQIAREAGVTEGVIYHHYRDKAELLLAVTGNSMGDFREVLNSLPLQVGQDTVRKNLDRTLQVAYEFQFRIAPIVCSLFADVQLLGRTREILNQRQCGPECVVDALSIYLQAEQRLGRVNPDVSPRAAAEILLASGFHTAMLDHLLGRDLPSETRRLRVSENIQALLAGLEPNVKEVSAVPKDRDVE
jgi:AcrR family transcriptional regulator